MGTAFSFMLGSLDHAYIAKKKASTNTQAKFFTRGWGDVASAHKETDDLLARVAQGLGLPSVADTLQWHPFTKPGESDSLSPPSTAGSGLPLTPFQQTDPPFSSPGAPSTPSTPSTHPTPPTPPHLPPSRTAPTNFATEFPSKSSLHLEPSLDIRRGSFRSPLADRLPASSRSCLFHYVAPKGTLRHWFPDASCTEAVCPPVSGCAPLRAASHSDARTAADHDGPASRLSGEAHVLLPPPSPASLSSAGPCAAPQPWAGAPKFSAFGAAATCQYPCDHSGPRAEHSLVHGLCVPPPEDPSHAIRPWQGAAGAPEPVSQGRHVATQVRAEAGLTAAGRQGTGLGPAVDSGPSAPAVRPPCSEQRSVMAATTAAPPGVVILLPATGEENISDRLVIAKQLIERKGYACIIVTAPYYGDRRPPTQHKHFIETVEDFLYQSVAIMQEAAMLRQWVADVHGAGVPVAISGFSWGGSMSACSAIIAASSAAFPERMACIPYVGSATPAVMVDSGLHGDIHWPALLHDDGSDNVDAATKRLFRVLIFAHLDRIVEAEQLVSKHQGTSPQLSGSSCAPPSASPSRAWIDSAQDNSTSAVSRVDSIDRAMVPSNGAGVAGVSLGAGASNSDSGGPPACADVFVVPEPVGAVGVPSTTATGPQSHHPLSGAPPAERPRFAGLAGKIGSVENVGMRHDSFVRKAYSDELTTLLEKRTVQPNFSARTHSGGHVYAFLRRCSYQTDAILRAMERLETGE